ncbi:hypothetical protein CDLVIII_3920 [Clostridium sp. DL-VIII]|uniref:hypothetical protein n=1 Tax=Clostridium sp. DL-VIII TaxID=641107 RepID=UPI00023B0120|nr:hypothetical protein [Clostridium sp. DL-VIII]EHJ00463.1 hypothetical protein CDLVIII_3920 [Clostridium sp. DL-VIII]
MKRFITIFSISLFLSISLNTISVFAQQAKTLTQGIYNVRDSNLLVGSPITARMTSSNDKAIIIVIGPDQNIHALERLGPGIPQEILPPLDYDQSIIIYTNGSVVLS